MRWAGKFQNFLNIWLNKLTNKFNAYCLPVASHTTSKSTIQIDVAKVDSGASQHYIKNTHSNLLKNITEIQNGPSIQLSNNHKLQVSHQAQIDLHKQLPHSATKALILPELTNESLLSVGQLCENNCTVEFGRYFATLSIKTN